MWSLIKIEAKGVRVTSIPLHVGLGTFGLVMVEDIESHDIYAEFYQVTQEIADILNETRKKRES